ncbi:MAG TPA: hypothetical protein VG206_20625 [Terriglobia bacterium]|nr:hypothetical protein [Terriglobia bacterium]
MRVALRVSSSYEHWDGGCEFALVEVTPELAALALRRIAALGAQKSVDPDSFQVLYYQIAAVECQQMVVRLDSIALSAIPKHASFYVQTAEIPLAMLEAAIVQPARG